MNYEAKKNFCVIFYRVEMLDNRNTYFDIFALLSRNSYRQTR